jgi:NAD(P)-dependent dehydrogenase (short-subunit alcohol dehydrogenase family)
LVDVVSSTVDRRIALVTGAAAGIGRAVVDALLDENIFIAAVDIDRAALEELEAASAGRVCAICADASVADQIAQAVAATIDRWKRIDILVNNVGGSVGGSHLDAPLADWNATLALNLMSQVLFIQAVAPIMKQRRHGRIVNISSNAGKYRGNTGAGNVAYSAAKGAVLQLTRSAAWELGRYGITVNAVAPGSVLTEAGLREEQHLAPAQRARMLRETPLGRFAAPREIASIVAFLASQSAGYVTGITIAANGGWCTG